VLLRRLAAEDLAAFHGYRQDPAVARYQDWLPLSESEALEFINAMAAARLFVPGVWAQLAIARVADNALVGDIGLFVAENGAHAEIGFTLAPGARRRGYASTAVAAAIDLLFERTAVPRVLGITDARNDASVRLLERVGMTRIESRAAVFKGAPCIEWVYSRSR
jgi:aminoglycoside 6'-N-acetyltransferase